MTEEQRAKVAEMIQAKLDAVRQTLATMLVSVPGKAGNWRVSIMVRNPSNCLFLNVTNDDPAEVAKLIAEAPVVPIPDPVL